MIVNKRIIDTLAWWIPVRKWRDNFRVYINNKFKNYTIDNIVLITGQNCNLKCRECANFSPYLRGILPFYSAEDIINDLRILTKNIELKHLQIQGGEFFIHPQQYKILKYISRNKKIKRILIATNGMVIPHKRVLDLIKENKNIRIRISNYGDINNTQSLKLKDKLDNYGINHFMHTFARGNSYWSYCGDINMERLSEEEMLYYYNNCIFAKYCLTLENGLVSICSRATIAHLVQNFEFSDKCGIYIRENFNLSNFLLFAKERSPVEACYYCYGTKGKQIIPAEQMNKEELQEALNYIKTRQDKTRQDKTRLVIFEYTNKKVA